MYLFYLGNCFTFFWNLCLPIFSYEISIPLNLWNMFFFILVPYGVSMVRIPPSMRGHSLITDHGTVKSSYSARSRQVGFVSSWGKLTKNEHQSKSKNNYYTFRWFIIFSFSSVISNRHNLPMAFLIIFLNPLPWHYTQPIRSAWEGDGFHAPPKSTLYLF